MAAFGKKKLKDEEKSKPYKYGFVLSGGAAKCFAQLGAVKAFAEKGIRPDIVAGTSAGAMAAAFLADGYEPDTIVAWFDKLTYRDFTEFTLPHSGISKTTKLRTFIEKHLRARTFAELRIPLYVAATDFDNGKATYFSEGPLLDPVVASCSVPIAFTPTVINGVTYVDGGLFDNLPVAPIRDKCETIIGIDVNPLTKKPHGDNMKEVINNTFTMIVRSSSRSSYPQCDILICPQEMDDYTLIDVNKAKKIFKAGYEEAKRYLAKKEI